jgi:hypothetical protein
MDSRVTFCVRNRPDLNVDKLRLIEMSLIAGTSLLLCACATPDLAWPTVATVHSEKILPGDKGQYYDDENKALLISESIPASWFVSTPRGWFLTESQVIQAADIRAAKRNPGVWSP